MPSIERQGRLQKALLWNFLSDDAQGEPVVELNPVEIDVRYDLGLGTGGFIAIRSTLIVDRDVDIGSIIKLGMTLDDWQGTGSAFEDGQYLKVVSFHRTPDVRAREFKYIRLSDAAALARQLVDGGSGAAFIRSL